MNRNEHEAPKNSPLAAQLRASIRAVKDAMPWKPQPEEEGLRGDQLDSFKDIVRRIESGETISKLCGYAGTGKTFLLARIAQWAKRNRYNVTIAAPTHKAAGVIQQKLGNIPGVEVKTIHSLLGMKLEPDMENDTGGHVVKSGESKNKVKDGLVICDEASMIGRVLKEEIDNLHGVRWLFVGDLAQLPPVGEGVSELLDEPDSTLETVLRQSHGSEILNLATAIRGGDMSMEFEEGKDVFKLDTAEELFQAALERFRSPEYQQDAAHARMLVFKNDRRKAINQRMRQLLIGQDDPYVPGEWLVMYAAFSPEKSRLAVLAEHAKQATFDRSKRWAKFYEYKKSLGNSITRLHVSEEVRITDAVLNSIDIEEWNFKVWRLTVEARGGVFELPVPTEEEAKRIEAIKTEMADHAQQSRKRRDEYEVGCSQWEEEERDRKGFWSVYFTLDEIFAQVDYAYAMTVHKSQGSTFDHAFVDVPDLLSSGGMQQRILYTACTRPAKTLTFYK